MCSRFHFSRMNSVWQPLHRSHEACLQELSHHFKNADHQLQPEVSSWLPINCCQKPHPPMVTWKAHMDSSWPKVWDCCIGLLRYSFWYLFLDKLIGGTSITHVLLHMVRWLFMHKYVVRITYLYAILICCFRGSTKTSHCIWRLFAMHLFRTVCMYHSCLMLGSQYGLRYVSNW